MALDTIVTTSGFAGGGFGVPGLEGISPTVIAAGGAVLSAAIRALSSGGGGGGKTAFQVGSDIDIISNAEAAASCNGTSDKRFKLCNGVMVEVKRRRRRRRLLTCTDKVDIGFITGVLGKGSGGQSAISSMLARCG